MSRFSRTLRAAELFILAALFSSLGLVSAQPLPHRVVALLDEIHESRRQGNDRIEISDIVLDGTGERSIVLEPFTVFGPDAEIVVHGDSGDRLLPVPRRTDLRGTVMGEPGSLVFISVGETGTRGLISLPDALYVIDRDATGGELVVHEPQPRSNRGWKCGTEGPPSRRSETVKPRRNLETNALAPPIDKTFEIAIDTDHELYLDFSNIDEMVRYVGDLVAVSSLIQDRDLGVRLRISHLSIWETADDPWSAARDPSTRALLNELGTFWFNERTSVRRDVVHLLSSRPLDGGRAYLDKICVDDELNGGEIVGPYGVSTALTTDIRYASWAWDVDVFTHELGHTLGSPHTHCYDPPLDQCYTGEDGCYSGAELNFVDHGTLMSYCDLPRMTFGIEGEPTEAVLQLIRNRVGPRIIRPELTAPEVICGGGTFTASATTLAGMSYMWTVANGQIVSGQGTPQITVTAGSSGATTIELKIDSSDVCVEYLSRSISIIAPSSVTIESASAVCSGSSGNLASVPDAGAEAMYTWSISNGVITGGLGTHAIEFSAGDSGLVELSVTVTTDVCSGTDSVALPVSDAPSGSLSVLQETAPPGSLNNQAEVVGADPETSYHWKVTNGWVREGQGTSRILFGTGSTGTTIVEVEFGKGGCTAIRRQEIPLVRPFFTRLEPEISSVLGYSSVKIIGAAIGTTEVFSKDVQVRIGDVPPVRLDWIDRKTLQILTPPHAVGTAKVRVSNPDGYETDASLTYGNYPHVVSLEPSTGPYGESVEIIVDGAGFLPDSTVYLNTTASSSLVDVELETTFMTPGRLRAVVPPTEVGYITVFSPTSGWFGVSGLYFDRYDPDFRIFEVVPDSGPAAGGTVVTIRGKGFTPETTVDDFTGLELINSGEIRAITTAHPAGSIEPVIVRNGTSSASFRWFSYNTAGIEITSVSPSFGPSHGGTTATISGSGFWTVGPIDRVYFNGNRVWSFQSRSDEEIVVVVPQTSNQRATRPSTIRLECHGCSPAIARTATGLFEYRVTPALLAVQPREGPSSGGTVVTIDGMGFVEGTTVRIGGVPSPSLTFVDPSRIIAVTPAVEPGEVPIVVTNPDGTEALGTMTFRFLPCESPPTATVEGEGIVCPGGSSTISVALTGEPPWTVTWSDGFVQSGITTTSATREVTPPETTEYSATTVSDARCMGSTTGTAVVTVKPAASAEITGPGWLEPDSTGHIVSVPDAGTGATYQWAVTNATITSGAATREITLSVGTASPATVSVTVTLGDCSTTSVREIPVTNAVPGDANGDLSVTVADIFYLINNLFAGGPAPIGPGDANGDGTVSVADIFYLINYLFAGGPAPT